jgi:hypothetical protein
VFCDREEDDEAGPALAGVLPDGGPVLSAHECSGRPVPLHPGFVVVVWTPQYPLSSSRLPPRMQDLQMGREAESGLNDSIRER